MPDVPALFTEALPALFPNFSPRESQTILSQAIYDNMTSEGQFMGEAPCGVGKSLAYLMPAMILASQGDTVCISTNTKALQEQILEKDIPLLLLLFPENSVRPVTMKGRSNYICDAEFSRCLMDINYHDDKNFARLTKRKYAGRWNGEKSTLGFNYAQWNNVSSTSDTCIGIDCAFYNSCAYMRQRQELASGNLIIVNHALLLTDAQIKSKGGKGILPAYQHLIIDEGHHLPDVADNACALTITEGRIKSLLKRLEALESQVLVPEDFIALNAFLCDLKAICGPSDCHLDLDTMTENSQSQILYFWTQVKQNLKLADICLRSDLPKDSKEDFDETHYKLLGLSKSIQSFLTDGDGIFLPSEEYIRYSEMDSSGKVSYHAVRTESGKTLQEILWNPLKGMAASVSLVSATFATGNGFGYPLYQLGLSSSNTTTLKVDSPFDFQNHAMLYCPDCVEISTVMDLLATTQGRAFILCTSWERVYQYEKILKSSPYQVLVQGTNVPNALLTSYRNSERSVLIGTSSFWEGVDIQGAGLSLVIIDKLPFDNHNHPLLKARYRQADANGRNSFQDIAIPAAQLKLKQGVGRLIRSVTDTGIVAILDTRLRDKSYGKQFVRSLPPFARSGRIAKVKQFWLSVSGEKDLVLTS